MFIKITPLDTLFFRDGRPFSRGEETWTTSSILPNPSVVWGALFSMLWSQGLVDIDKKNDKRKLKISRFFLCDEEKFLLYLPSPLDIFKEKISEKIVYTQQDKSLASISNYSLSSSFVPKSEKEIQQVVEQFLNISDFSNAYYREDKNLTLVDFNDFQKRDYKVGISRDNEKRTAETGKLYRVETTQLLKNWSFVVECDFEEEDKFPANGLIKLGGEGKTASFEVYKDWVAEEIHSLDKTIKSKFEKTNKEIFKLYFSSPVFLLESTHFTNKNFEVIATFSGKYLSIGGFDVKLGKPKSMLKALPRGTTFYLKNIFDLSYEDIKKHVAEELESLNDFGFGCFEILPLKN